MRVLITGGTNGMGKGVAKVLAGIDNQTHEIIILCRSKERGETTIKEIEADTKTNKVSMVLCDLTKLSEIQNVIKEIRSHYDFSGRLIHQRRVGLRSQTCGNGRRTRSAFSGELYIPI